MKAKQIILNDIVSGYFRIFIMSLTEKDRAKLFVSLEKEGRERKLMKPILVKNEAGSRFSIR